MKRMSKILTIRDSAQARLLLYKLLSAKLHDVENKLLQANPRLWEQLVFSLEAVSDSEIHADAQVLSLVFSYIDRSAREGLERQLARLMGRPLWLGIHAGNLLDAFVQEHTKLIKSIRREQLDRISSAITRGVRNGLLPKDITQEISTATNIGKRRAKVIARNAPLQYSGALTRQHQGNAGIKSYIWQTSRDERVRDSHRKRDGEIYNWNNGGPYPRSEVNCRCDAIPIIKSS